MSKAERLKKLHQKMIEEILDIAVVLLDIDGTILTWNKGAEAIKGYTADEILGGNFSIFYIAEDREAKAPQKILEQAKKEGRARYIGKRVKKKTVRTFGAAY